MSLTSKYKRALKFSMPNEMENSIDRASSSDGKRSLGKYAFPKNTASTQIK